MKFRSKLIGIYAIFMLIITIVIGGIYYSNHHRAQRKQETQSLEYFSNHISVRYDDMVSKMEYGINFLLSDMNVLDNLILISSASKNDKFPQTYKLEARSAIQKSLNSYFLNNNFYRVVIFNEHGDVLVSNNFGESIIDKNKNFKDILWLDSVKGIKDRSVLIGNHPDDWGLRYNPQVVSLVKEIQGMNIGYVEVQMLVESFITDLNWTSDDHEILMVLEDDIILYSTKEREEYSYYMDLVKNKKTGVGEYTNPNTKETELIAIRYSDYTKVSVLVIENEEVVQSKELYSTYYTIAACTFFACISMAFIWISSYFLTRPIKKMQTLMEETQLDTMNQNILMDKQSDEFEALYGSYKGLMERLSEAMHKEKESSLLQMQAQFDTLQAQVNPHFIYNVLNVISNKGMLLEDESICEICSSLATMLRYSTNTKERFASIKAEIMYLEHYSFLLKSRFRHRFEYENTVSEEIMDYTIPKLTFQQLIENSIYHGFKNSAEVMKIKVSGWLEESTIYLRVHDNGQGFDDAEIKGLYDKFDLFIKRYQQRKRIMEMEIGGMGLVNTFARLYLIYEEGLSFKINNCNGAEITIGIKIRK